MVCRKMKSTVRKERPSNPLSQPTAERELPLDTLLLSEAVIELNISRKNVGIYPPGHVQITRSIDRAFEILQSLFEVRPEMTLGVAKDTLLVGHDYLDQKNPVYRDFALSLNQQGIAAVTFLQRSGQRRDGAVSPHPDDETGGHQGGGRDSKRSWPLPASNISGSWPSITAAFTLPRSRKYSSRPQRRLKNRASTFGRISYRFSQRAHWPARERGCPSRTPNRSTLPSSPVS